MCFLLHPQARSSEPKLPSDAPNYARAFIAVVKALDMIDDLKDMRYVIYAKSDDYKRVFEKSDKEMTINGHQFVMVRIGSVPVVCTSLCSLRFSNYSFVNGNTTSTVVPFPNSLAMLMAPRLFLTIP